MNEVSGVTPGEPGGHGSGGGSVRALGRVIENDPRGNLSWLTIGVPDWIGARPGQFALLQAEPSCSFLSRALSVADEEKGGVSFLIDPVGEGTRELCSVGPGDPVWVLGPLGNGFELEEIIPFGSPADPTVNSPERPGRLLVVAGGVGIAPFPLFLSRLADRGSARAVLPEVVALVGFRDAAQAQGVAALKAVVPRITESALSFRLIVATEDGSLGPSQKVTDLLEAELRPGDRVVVCGPAAMSAAVWQLCETVAGVRTWFSLEANMACGVGSCHGCAIALSDGSFARVCHEGPVFPGEKVFARSSMSPDWAEESA